MKILESIALVSLSAVAVAAAQVDFPSNPMVGPKKYEPRKVGGAVDPGAKVEGKGEGGMVRYVTHVVLYEPRIWMSADGKPLKATLIAFEDLEAMAPEGSPQPKMPAPPERPTVVKDEKVRLLVNLKPVEVPLERLCIADREFIDRMRVAVAMKMERK